MYNPGGHLLFTNSNFTIPGLSSIIQVVTWKIFLTNLDFTIPVLSSFIQVVVTKKKPRLQGIWLKHIAKRNKDW